MNCTWILAVTILAGLSAPQARAIGFLIPNQGAAAIRARQRVCGDGG